MSVGIPISYICDVNGLDSRLCIPWGLVVVGNDDVVCSGDENARVESTHKKKRTRRRHTRENSATRTRRVATLPESLHR